jgi:hypothetical protein
MKKRFVFVGSLPSHMMGVVSFRALGQAVELTEEQASDLSIGGSLIVRGEDFEGFGFDAKELTKFGAFGAHEYAPAEFHRKRILAVQAAEKLREEFEAALHTRAAEEVKQEEAN